ncbi:MAG: hypothetical protein ACNYWU_02750 [Desulfobacterales bacterium]
MIEKPLGVTQNVKLFLSGSLVHENILNKGKEYEMKKIIVLLVIMSLSMAIPLYAGEKKPLKAAKIEQKIFRILGDNDWLDTGFVLNPSDRVTVNATGQVFFSNGTSDSGVNPDGYLREHYISDYSGDNACCGDPIENENCGHAAFIGKDSQGVFFLGKSKLITGKKGKFYIGINDCSFKDKYYNTGEFNVSIKVVRGWIIKK